MASMAERQLSAIAVRILSMLLADSGHGGSCGCVSYLAAPLSGSLLTTTPKQAPNCEVSRLLLGRVLLTLQDLSLQ